MQDPKGCIYGGAKIKLYVLGGPQSQSRMLWLSISRSHGNGSHAFLISLLNQSLTSASLSIASVGLNTLCPTALSCSPFPRASAGNLLRGVVALPFLPGITSARVLAYKDAVLEIGWLCFCLEKGVHLAFQARM